MTVLGRGFRPAAMLGVLALGMGSGLSPPSHRAQARSAPGTSELGPTSQALQTIAPTKSAPTSATAPTAVAPGAAHPPPQSGATGHRAAAAARPAANAYVHYYLWWSTQHWHDKLGAAYPYSANPLPQPGYTDAAGCNPKVRYPGATIVDLPSEGM
ncbi:MAG TPA: hypothetical protein VGR61_11145 [Candidatus Dormibacteraeota bacterium]|nr:hypothetical protein [Candidatus Dormibacteraeota bacterium]